VGSRPRRREGSGDGAERPYEYHTINRSDSYDDGKISSGFGAQVLGCDRLEFYRLISEHCFSVIDYASEELEEEAQSSRDIAARIKGS
jgi:Uncharacterised protein family (UPF0175)